MTRNLLLIWIFTFACNVVQAATCLEILEHLMNRPVLRKLDAGQREKIQFALEQFYESDNERFYDEILGLRFQEPGAFHIQIEDVTRLPFDQSEIYLFHNLNKRFSYSFVAVAGVGIIRVIRNNTTKELTPAYLLLKNNGLPLPAYFGKSTHNGIHHALFEYIPGPTLLDLRKLKLDGKIAVDRFNEALERFEIFREEFLNTLFDLIFKGQLKGDVAARFIPNLHNSVYYRGKWYFYHPSLK